MCAENTIKECAEEKSDFELLGKIKDVDMRAREAMYHESCRRAYVRREEQHAQSARKSDHNTFEGLTKDRKDANQHAFIYLTDYVQKRIVDSGSVERMSMLRVKYLDYMSEHYMI